VSRGRPRKPAAVTLFNLYNGRHDDMQHYGKDLDHMFRTIQHDRCYGSLRQDVSIIKKLDADSRQEEFDCFSQDSATASIHARLIRRGLSRTVGSNTSIPRIPLLVHMRAPAAMLSLTPRLANLVNSSTWVGFGPLYIRSTTSITPSNYT
jgi:hypothetical protein